MTESTTYAVTVAACPAAAGRPDHHVCMPQLEKQQKERLLIQQRSATRDETEGTTRGRASGAA